MASTGFMHHDYAHQWAMAKFQKHGSTGDRDRMKDLENIAEALKEINETLKFIKENLKEYMEREK